MSRFYSEATAAAKPECGEATGSGSIGNAGFRGTGCCLELLAPVLATGGRRRNCFWTQSPTT